MIELAMIIDTECTGLKDPDPLEFCYTEELAFPPRDDYTYETHQFAPRKPIEFGAMATHHIYPGRFDGLMQWPGSWVNPAAYLIGHNVDYDWQALGKPTGKRICTLAMSRKEWPDIDSHVLSALQYFFASEVEEANRVAAYHAVSKRLTQYAHTAEGDVDSCYAVLQSILRRHPQITSWEELYQKSERDRIPEFMNFGKYGPDSDWARQNNAPKGMRCADVFGYDLSYYRWLFGGKCERVNSDPYLQQALKKGTGQLF